MTVETTGAAQSIAERAGTRVGDYIALLKPRVMSLVVFTGFAGLVVAPGSLHPLQAAVVVLCIAISAGAAGAINMWYERDIDALMERTRKRPIPAGRIAPNKALAFGVTLNVLPVLLMGLAVNWVAAALLAFAAGFYIFVYTIWLKRRTPQNIVIGGAAGALPPMIGWAAVTGSVSLESVALFLIIFMWTPPHFWALALLIRRDYAAAGIPMLPVVEGEASTHKAILMYTLILTMLTMLLYTASDTLGLAYLITATTLGVFFIAYAVQLFKKVGPRASAPIYKYSLLYLAVLFVAIMIDA